MDQIKKIIDRSNSVSMYTNGFNINIGAFDVSIELLEEKRNDVDPNMVDSKQVASISMSPHLAKTLAVLLNSLVADYEKNFGSLPEVNKLLGK